MKKIYALLTVAITACFSPVFANNIQLANTTITGQNTASHYNLVGFDVSWENSWRVSNNENNYDAAWVFVKFRKKGATGWQHATINATGHTAATGATISTPTDGKGVFVYRSADGIGTVAFNGNKIRWNYNADGVLDTDSVEINVFACEMVYVPQGSFYLGSNGTEIGHFRRGDKDTTFMVTSESAITVGPAATNLTFVGSSYTGTPAGPIPASFPKGFNAFYTMKYECSYQQYVDFLNNLDAAKATVRNMGTGITGTHPSLIATFPERGLDYASIADLTAYSDWAALRPMTELEYEKAARGYNIAPVQNEYVWGNTTIVNAAGPVNPGEPNETVTTGNTLYGSVITRPLRTGVFATTLTNRITSGGSYYGIMEMSGNLAEYTITVGSTSGRLFTGLHGDGYLEADGTSNMPFIDATSAFGNRGGGWNSGVGDLRISDRSAANYGNYITTTLRYAAYGIRCVRTAP